jgi:hypothetical protein
VGEARAHFSQRNEQWRLAHVAETQGQIAVVPPDLVSLRVVGSYSNDARMTRWPFSFTAGPLLHQVWGHDPRLGIPVIA